MKDKVERASRWIYGGVWAVLVRWFCVPAEPPTLPAGPGEATRSFRPSEAFLRYLKFLFWFGLVAIDGAIFVAWAFTLLVPILAAVLALPALVLAVLPDIVAYIAIHLRYDTTWYVLSARSMRIRRGIWVIHETTITYENVQNIKVTQGPLQRFFGISNVLVETAGGGARTTDAHGNVSVVHHGLIEGVTNAHEIRDLILARLRKTQTTGLGDEHQHEPAHASAPAVGGVRWSAPHVETLREIRDLVCALP